MRARPAASTDVSVSRLHHLSAPELAGAIRERTLSSLELVDHYLDRIERHAAPLEDLHPAAGLPTTFGSRALRMLRWSAFTRRANLSRQPSATLPVHHSPAGLPVDVMLTGRQGRDDLVLDVAAELEELFASQTRHPEVCSR